MEIAIIGGTGLLGRQVSEELRARGHEVRVISRGAPKYRADLTTGAGLDEPGLVVRDSDGILSVLTLTLDDGRIVAIDVVRDPGKLTRVADSLAAE